MSVWCVHTMGSIIINPMTETVQIYLFEGIEDSVQYTFNDEIPIGIYPGFKITISQLLK